MKTQNTQSLLWPPYTHPHTWSHLSLCEDFIIIDDLPNSQGYTEKPCLEERISGDGTHESVLSTLPGDSNALKAVALLWVAHDHHYLETQLL